MKQNDKLARIKEKLVKSADADLTEVMRARAAWLLETMDDLF